MTDGLRTPLDNNELPKIREQARDFEREQWMLASDTYVKQIHDQRMMHMIAIKEYGVLTIRTLFLLNGAAILGSLTFIATFFGKNDQTVILIGVTLAKYISYSIIWFGAGLMCAIVASGVAYLNFNYAHMTFQTPADLYFFIKSTEVDPPNRKFRLLTNITMYTAVGTTIIGMICFVCGALNAVKTFSILGA